MKQNASWVQMGEHSLILQQLITTVLRAKFVILTEEVVYVTANPLPDERHFDIFA